MTQGDNGVAPARWRIQLLSSPPQLIGMDEEVPQSGWAVQEETSVFKDGAAVGLYGSLTARPGARSWNLRYEWIESPGTRQLPA
ncbi:MAG: hypothetical protein JWO21_1221 [Solirubrobacterales bacterium]|jgi:hypothetical protein|nr:hypothetical protein [Solirubrobacterales bacterium]MEA2655941.1 hypothetical protein [Chloroflexota bacterium]